MNSAEKILFACREMREARAAVHGERCSDGRCVFRDRSKPIGMQTNGCCHCLDGVEYPKRRAIRILAANRIDALAQITEILVSALRNIRGSAYEPKYVEHEVDKSLRMAAEILSQGEK